MTFHRTRCAHCRQKFTPERPSQIVHVECVEAWTEAKAARAAARVERAETRRRKEAIKTLADLKREAQQALNRWIVHVRDKDRPCISCGRHHEGAWHAGHYLSRGAAPQHALNPLNVWKQCAPCNTYLHGNQAAYRIRLVELIGLAAVEALEQDCSVRKWSREELINIKLLYRRKYIMREL